MDGKHNDSFFNITMQNSSRKRILNQHAFLTEILRHLSRIRTCLVVLMRLRGDNSTICIF